MAGLQIAVNRWSGAAEWPSTATHMDDGADSRHNQRTADEELRSNMMTLRPMMSEQTQDKCRHSRITQAIFSAFSHHTSHLQCSGAWQPWRIATSPDISNYKTHTEWPCILTCVMPTSLAAEDTTSGGVIRPPTMASECCKPMIAARRTPNICTPVMM